MRRHRQRQRDAALGFFVRKFGLALLQAVVMAFAVWGFLMAAFSL